jgi:outer membrane protein assembly factor BamB/ferredoxin
MPTVYYEGVAIECEEGAVLRDVLVAAERAPYNSAAEYTNCGGNGICGTCAVRVDGAASEPTARERVRRAAPPLRGKDVRLSCQTRVEGDVTVLKPPGFWGQHAEASPEPATVGEGATGEWPTFRRTATNGGATEAATGPGPDGAERWRVDLDGGVRGGLCAAPTHDLLYAVTGSATVVALDLGSGETAWTAGVDLAYGTGDAAVPPSPVVDTGSVYVGSSYVKAFDATTGEERWTADVAADRVRATPALRSNTLYVPASDDSVVAFDTATGERRWRIALDDADDADTTSEMAATRPGTLAVADDRVYVGSSAGVHAFDALSRGLDWETATAPVRSPPAVLDDWLWVGTDEGVAALGATEGTPHWDRSLDDPVVAAPVVDVAASRVYLATTGGDVVALEAATGDVAWTTPLDRRVLASPALADGTLYVGHVAGDLLAVDVETGAVVGDHAASGQLYASPVVHDESLHYATGTGAVYAVERTTSTGEAERAESAHPAHSG